MLNKSFETIAKKKENSQKLVKKIQDESKEKLLPMLQEKSQELTSYIVDLLHEKGEENVNNTQILSLIARKSLSEIAMNTSRISYTPQEIVMGFNLYLDMINKINAIKKYPPTVESFSMFMGISRNTYNNWLVDSEKKDVMDYIHSYLLGVLATGGLTGEVKEISSMFLQKCMGKQEIQQPIQHEVTVKTDIDEINAQLEALKGKKIIDAEYDEVEE